MENDLTKRFREKVEKDNPNLKKLAEDLGLKYDRMYKWLKGKGNPKSPDDKIVESWINGTNSKKNNYQTEIIDQDLNDPESILKKRNDLDKFLEIAATLTASLKELSSTMNKQSDVLISQQETIARLINNNHNGYSGNVGTPNASM